MEEEIIVKQRNGKEKSLANLLPHQWKKGQSGNPSGRTKGKTMKEYARELLACQTEKERQDFLNGLSKDIIWKMAEGLPQQDITSGGEKIIPIPIINVYTNNSDKQNIETDKENTSDTGGDISKQDNINLALPDSNGSVGQDTNTNEHSVGELPTPTQGSGEGLSEHNEGTPVLQGQPLG